MSIIANLFLILFIADGGFSLVDEIVPLLSPLLPFTAMRNLLAETVVLLAVFLYFCLGIDSRLPKRIFLPLILYVCLCPLSTWAFPELAEIKVFGVLAATLQLLLGMLPFCFFRKGEERSLTMPDDIFTAPFFKLKNTLLFFGANLAVFPLVLSLLLLAAADSYLLEHTSGFMRLGPGGIRMTERVYGKDNRTVRLAAMIHVGDRGYYDELAASIASARMIVLAEGVSDDEHLLRDRIDYSKVAALLGLTSQQDIPLKGRIIDPDEFASPRFAKRGGDKQSDLADILRADLDISDFKPSTVLFLNNIGSQLKEDSSLFKSLTALNSWAEKNMTSELYETVMNDILHKRDKELIRHLDQALARYDTVVIPWGALHMKEIEAEIQRRGFTLQSERERVSIGFRRILKGFF